MQAPGQTAAAGRTGPIRLGLVGRAIQQSRTPAMHRAEGAAQGLTLRYDLLDTDAMDPAEADIARILDRAEAEGFAGLNITYPFKRAVMAHLHEISASARQVEAVNTVVFREGRRHGHNTDLWGFSEGLRQGLPGADLSCVLLLGAGGGGSAVAHALAGAGCARLLVADTDAGRAGDLVAALTDRTGMAAEPVADMARAAAAASGIVNATPMGMAKLPGCAIDTGLLDPRHWVADIVYFPMETALLAAARARGCQTLSGAGMAVFQAVRAFSLFTGLAPDAGRMRATFAAFDRAGA